MQGDDFFNDPTSDNGLYEVVIEASGVELNLDLALSYFVESPCIDLFLTDNIDSQMSSVYANQMLLNLECRLPYRMHCFMAGGIVREIA